MAYVGIVLATVLRGSEGRWVEVLIIDDMIDWKIWEKDDVYRYWSRLT